MKSKRIVGKILTLIIVFLGIIIMLRQAYPQKYMNEVAFCAKKYNLDENLIYAVIKTESNFRETVVSRSGAVGLMQVMPNTGREVSLELDMDYSDEVLMNYADNIEIGCRYLSKQIAKYGNLNTALAAYNAGPGNVDEWLKIKNFSADGKTLKKIPFPETNMYVKKMTINKAIYQILY